MSAGSTFSWIDASPDLLSLDVASVPVFPSIARLLMVADFYTSRGIENVGR